MKLQELYKMLQREAELEETIRRLECESVVLSRMYHDMDVHEYLELLQRNQESLFRARENLDVVRSAIRIYCGLKFKRKYYNELFE
jgi:hypothetical protein